MKYLENEDTGSQYGDRICECCMENPALPDDFLCRHCSNNFLNIDNELDEEEF